MNRKHMRSYTNVTLLLSLLFIGCAGKADPGSRRAVVRDTSITVSNAYTGIFFDSLLLERFITTDPVTDSIAVYMRDFYNSRNYSAAWFDESGLTVQAKAFWSAHNMATRLRDESSIYDMALHQAIDTMLGNDSVVTFSRLQIELIELKFTKHFFEYIRYAYNGKVDPSSAQWHIPRRKLEPPAMLDTFLRDSSGEWKSLNTAYRLLQSHLFKYSDIADKGGWARINLSRKTIAPGQRDSAICQVKRRLISIIDHLPGDTSEHYTSDWVAPVKNAQARFGLKQDGVINAEFVRQLNIPVSERIKQILINLERMRWMPELPANCLIANIPEFSLHVMEGSKEVLSMRIIVGKAANRTVIFSDQLKYIVFSPYWNVPRSIVRNEIYPAMKRNRNYLKRHNMEVVGYSGGLPRIRQRPGSGNALGRVKFIFPNNYNIYFHDTPNPSLFSRQRRAFSHGCIRLQRPFELASYLLRDQSEWNDKKIRAAMSQRTEKWVPLKKAVPIFITYFTAWVDENGQLHFADDLYGHDKTMAAQLFEQ